MKKVYQTCVRVVYFFTWPFTGLLLHNSNRVRVLVASNNKLLLQKTSYGLQKWSVPGGGIDRGESASAAAVREVYEETGLKIDERNLHQIGHARIANNRLGWPRMNVTFYFIEYRDETTVRISHPLEIVDLKWFEVDALPGDLSPTVPLARKLLHDYKSAIN